MDLNIKHKISVLLLILGVAMASGYARTIRDFFISEPNNALVLIDKNSRLDMLDYFDNGKIVAVKAALRAESELIDVTDNYIALHVTESNIVEMYLHSVGKSDTVIAIINTVFLPAAESKILFYNAKWQQLDTSKNIKLPTITDFIAHSATKQQKEEINRMVKFPLISYSFDKKNGNIVAKHGLSDFLNKTDFEKIKPFLKDSLVYELNGLKYKIKK